MDPLKLPSPTARQALLHMAVLSFASGPLVVAAAALIGHTGMVLTTLTLALASSFYTFLWFCRDRDARGYPRSTGLNMAMVAMSILAVPYYLVRSRTGIRKLIALGKMAAYVLVLILLTIIGMGLAIIFVPR